MKQLKIDFVSDVSCPWCIIGLKSLEQALGRLHGQIAADLHFQPFELNPDMGPGGQDVGEHLMQKYGMTEAQGAQNREAIRARGEALGFTFNMDKRSRIYNTFDAHRVLHWAGLEGKQHEMELKLFEAYFTKGEDPGSHEVLERVAREAGLDGERVKSILASDEFAKEVRERQAFYHRAGINSVPAVIINDRHLISGGQPPEVFEQALLQIATHE
ncbi:DsbA family oxidoreductase [Pseudoduganella sp. GCM10020061]|uniref:DsbA family oxidoreductase n=1 Tax=Pseudoduganella sp. GCM10020061 TaxID=3317345 RepID=UPI00362AFEDF